MTFAIGNRISHLRGTAPSPTADLYFAWSCADMIEDGRVLKLSPTVFRCGGTLIVFRHAGKLRRLPPHQRLIYVVDDDWRAGLKSGVLPIDYGLKLAWVEARAAKNLEDLADVIVVSSPALERRLRSRRGNVRIARIEPCWPPSSVEPGGTGSDAPVVAMLGGRSHAFDAGAVLPAVKTVLAEREEVSFAVSAETPLDAGLARCPRVVRVPSMPWDGYRRWMAARAFLLGLYPLLDTEFNRARSINKLLEYDQYGAAVLASETWEAAASAAAEGRCVLVGNDWRSWADRILEFLNDPDKAAYIARRNREAIAGADHAGRQNAFWVSLLN